MPFAGNSFDAMSFAVMAEPLSRTAPTMTATADRDTGMNDGTAETTETATGAATPWWQRLAAGLKRSSSTIGGAIADVIAKRQLDEATIEEIEDALIRADLGAETAGRIATELRYGRFNTSITAEEIKEVVAAEIEKALTAVAQPLDIDPRKRPFVI